MIYDARGAGETAHMFDGYALRQSRVRNNVIKVFAGLSADAVAASSSAFILRPRPRTRAIGDKVKLSGGACV